MAEFVMPSLGADMEVGRLIAWLKQPGDTITRGDVIAEIDTDKGIIEVECFTSGTIEKLLLEPGQKVPVGTVMAIIREEDKAAVNEAATAKQMTPPSAKPVTAPLITAKSEAAETTRLKISPVARKLAETLGVDPSSIKGTGPGGRITREDVEQAAKEKTIKAEVSLEAKHKTESKVEEDRFARMRQAIAGAMAKSKREIPHYYLSTTIDMQRAMRWLLAENENRTVANRLLYGVLLVKAVALALREYPELNSVWDDEQMKLKPEINVGIAISLRQGGLITPALHNTDQQSLDELMKSLQDLVKRTRAGQLRSSELSDSTITITNLGEQGVETVFGIIYPPQVALVGFGKVFDQPCVIDGQVVARPMVSASLSADHRASDGHRGGLFLNAVSRLLQEPEKL